LGGKPAPIKRIVDQTQLKKLLPINFLKGDIWKAQKEFKELRKKGLLSRKEYRGSRALNLKFKEYLWVEDEYIQTLAEHLTIYSRRLRHFSVEFDPVMVSDVSIVPLLKSIKHNFVGLVSLKLSLRKGFRLLFEDVHGFERLSSWLRPTLKRLDLDFAENRKSKINFPVSLGRAIMQNLHKLETLSLDFKNTQLPISLVRFFINTACSRMVNLKSLGLQMENCFLQNETDPPQASQPSHLQRLKLDFDRCSNLKTEYLLKLQSNILIACPELEELVIRLPNYKRFSGRFLSVLKEEFLQKLNLKRFAVELSHELEDTWQSYWDVLAVERAEETRIEHKIKQKEYGEEEESLFSYDTFIEGEEKEEFSKSFDEAGWVEYCEIEETRMWNEIEEQDKAERIIHEDFAEEGWERSNTMDEIQDLSKEESVK